MRDGQEIDLHRTLVRLQPQGSSLRLAELGKQFQFSSRSKLADTGDGRRRGPLRHGLKMRESLIGQEPEVAVPVAQCRPYVTLREAVLRGIVKHRA